MLFQADVVLIHAPSVYDFRKRAIMFGPVSDVVPSTPVFEMYPVGFNSLSEWLFQNGFSCRIVNLAYLMLRDPDFDVPKYLKKFKPKAFGIDLHWLAHSHGSLEVAKILKELHPDIPVIFGGFSSTYFHEELIKHRQVDYVLRGDSTEEPLVMLMRAIVKKLPKNDIPNLTWKDEAGEVQVNPLSYIPDNVNDYSNNYTHVFSSSVQFLSFIPFTPIYDWWRYPITAIMSCRGCTQNCIICGGSASSLKAIASRSRPAFRDPELIISDLRRISRLTNAPLFIIGDINQPGKEYASKILDGLKTIKMNNHLILELFRPAPREFFEKLGRSVENFDFEISPETHDEKLRQISGKRYSNEAMEDNIRWALENGCQKFDVFFMIGISGQTYDSVMETIDYCGKLLKKFPEKVVPFISPLAPFIDPGSLVHQNPAKYGYRILYHTLEEHRMAMLQPSWKLTLGYETEWMNRDRISDATYEAALRLNRLKAEAGLIAPEAASEVEERIIKARRLVAKIDEILADAPPEEQEARLEALHDDMIATSMASICEKEEIKWPVIRRDFNYVRIAFAILAHWTRNMFRSR
jgi:B12-binding domain/radical SAM domain protein